VVTPAQPSAAQPAGPVTIPAGIVQQLIEHARVEYPNEGCGLIVGDRPAGEGGNALRWEPTRNKAASPFRYEIHPDDLLRLTIATEDSGEAFWAIVHSHTSSPARPSATDLGLAFYPDALYILVSLAADEAEPTSGAPSVRAWTIRDGDATEVELLVGT
jgi:proteasome lid subunit RPN8/RPN11